MAPPLDPQDLQLVSALLDEALELDGERIEDWLANLPPDQSRLAPILRDMLAERLTPRGVDFMASNPKLALIDEATPHAGDRVGPYRLLHEIGRGGMGVVWLAESIDSSLKRKIALKLPRLAWGAGLAERMARERDIAASLEHPHIARLYDAGLDQRGRPFLAFEYIDGQPIDAWCAARDLDVAARLRLFVQVACAVAYAHARLVVHRDLKPSNVLVTADGQTHLLDFGIATRLGVADPSAEH
jgi:serine/threonine-protein kinase